MPLIALSTALLLAAPPAPDFYFEQTTVTLLAGQPSGPRITSRVWYAGPRIRLETGDAPGGPAFILRMDTGKAYRLDPARRVAVVLDPDELRARSQMDLSAAGSAMGAEAEDAARTVPLRTPRTLAGYPCRGYRITAGPTVMDLYVTSKLPLGIDRFADFLEWTGADEALGKLLTEIRKLPGFPLQTRTRVTLGEQVQETLATVTRIRVGAQPLSLFDPPLDYQLVDEDDEDEP